MKRAAGILDAPPAKWLKSEDVVEKTPSNIFEIFPRDVIFEILSLTFQDILKAKDESKSFEFFCKTRFSGKKLQLTSWGEEKIKDEEKIKAQLQTLKTVDSYFSKFNEDLIAHLINHKVSLETLFNRDESKLMQFCAQSSFAFENTIGYRLKKIKIQFDWSSQVTKKKATWENLHLPQLLNLCPNVERLSLDYEKDILAKLNTLTHKNVKSLNIALPLNQKAALILGSCFPHLKKIHCWDLEDTALDHFFQHLTEIKVDSGDQSNIHDFYAKNTATFPQITSLNINTPEDIDTLGNSVIGKPFPNLKKLALSGGGEYREINSTFSLSSSIEHLNLSFNLYTKGFLDVLTLQAPHLKSLGLSSAEDDNEEYGELHSSSLVNLLNGCTQLIALDLSTNRGVKRALANMTFLPRIEYLNLSFTELDDEDIFTILLKCPQVKFLDLQGNAITEKGATLLKMETLAPNLKKAYIDHNHISDATWINRLQAFVPGKLELITKR